MTIFDFRSVEALPLMLLMAHSFFKGVSFVFFETPANTLFLAELDIRLMPYVYIATAVITTVLGFVYSKLESRLTPGQLLVTTLTFLMISVVILYLALTFWRAPWVVMAMMVWKDVVWILGGLEFWALAGLLFDVRQGKRLFGLVGVGEVFSIVGGGFAIPWLVERVGTQGLLLISCAGFLGSMAMLVSALPLLNHSTQSHSNTLTWDHGKRGTEERQSWASMLKDRYLRIMLLISVLSYLGYYLIDYIFYEQVNVAFRDEVQLASFFGIFYAVLGLLHLVIGAFGAAPLLRRFGVGFGLLALPVMDAFGIFSLAGVNLFASAAAAILWIIVGTKLLDEVLRLSIDGPSYRILYQPLRADQQLRVQALRESIVEPLAIGISGLFLLLLTSWFSLGVKELSWVLFAVLAIWISLGVALRREYKTILLKALTRRRSVEGLSLTDTASLSVILTRLDSPSAAEAILCTKILEEASYTNIISVYRRLLSHPEATARAHGLEKIALKGNGLDMLIPDLRALIERESDQGLRASAVHALCVCLDTEGFEEVVLWLDAPELEIRQAAIVGLLRHGGINGVLAAGQRFNTLVSSSSTNDRINAAKLLGDAGIANFYQPLKGLLVDADVQVRRMAISAAGKLRTRQLLPVLIASLKDPHTKSAACAALQHFGEQAVPSMRKAFEEDNLKQDIKAVLIRTASRIGGSQVREWLCSELRKEDTATWQKALSGLVAQRWKATGEDAARVKALMQIVLVETAVLNSSLIDLADISLMSSALKGQLLVCRERLFLLLASLYPADLVLQTQRALLRRDSKTRANAIEALDNILPPKGKEPILALLEELSPMELRAQLGDVCLPPLLGTTGRLRAVSTRTECAPWLRAYALYAIGSGATAMDEPSDETMQTLARASNDPEDIVRETAHWAGLRLISIS